MVRQRADRRHQLTAHVGADPIAKATRIQPAQQLMLVGGAISPDQNVVDASRQRRHGAFHQAPIAAASRHVAVSKLVGHHDVLLGPQRDHRLIARAPVVGRKGAPLLALQDGRVDVDRRHRLRRPLLDKADQPASGFRQALEPLAFAWDVAGRTLPERRHRLVERLQKVPRRLRRWQAVPEQQRQRGVLSQLRQVLTALAAGSPEAEQPLHQLGWQQPALAPLDDACSRPAPLPHRWSGTPRSGAAPAMRGDQTLSAC